MGRTSGGVLTVSKVGVSAVTYIPYSGYNEINVVTAKTSQMLTRPALHPRTPPIMTSVLKPQLRVPLFLVSSSARSERGDSAGQRAKRLAPSTEHHYAVGGTAPPLPRP